MTSYDVAWGTAPGLADVKEFEEVTNTTIWLAKFKDNALEVGKKYYATVRATNGAGLLSDRLSSNGIVVGKSEYTFDNKSSAEFFFDTVNVNENGSRKDGGVGKTYGTLTVPEGAVEGEVKLRSYSLDEKTMDQNKTDEGPVSNPMYSKPKVCFSVHPFFLLFTFRLFTDVFTHHELSSHLVFMLSPVTVTCLCHSL